MVMGPGMGFTLKKFAGLGWLWYEGDTRPITRSHTRYHLPDPKPFILLCTYIIIIQTILKLCYSIIFDFLEYNFLIQITTYIIEERLLVFFLSFII